ncbi:MAG TPA: VOC family protein [Jiangellaceae bacterium]|nr:VOC family protein [Jiangellaceae bacterium]
MLGTLTGMAVALHHIVIDAHDLPTLARFWVRVLGWRILSEREHEIVIGAHEVRLWGSASCRSRT